MKKQLLVLVAALGLSGAANSQSTVTILVDMNGQTVSPNGVHIAGSFQDPQWQPDTDEMIDSDADGIYEYTASLADGVYQFKFLNGNSWGDVESVPAESRVSASNDNRFFVVDGQDVFVYPVAFSGNAPTGGSLLRFVLDLSTFTPNAAGVSVAGDFQVDATYGTGTNWTPGEIKMYDVDAEDNLSLYTVILYVPAGTQTYEYKYVNGIDWPEAESVPSGCANGGGNRTVAISGATVTKNCFSSCNESCVVLSEYSLTLNVDMRFNCAFDVTSTDTVDVAGTFNGYSGGPDYYLTDVDGDGIYSITLSNVTEGEVQYKARIIKNGSPNWEGGNNNIINLSADLDAPTRCFGFSADGECAPVPAPSDITFRVDLTEGTPAANIYLIGDFTSPQWQSGAIELLPVAAGIYETTVLDVCPGKIYYKFMNGPVDVTANEETFPDSTDRGCVEPSGVGGFNRVFVRPDANPATLAFKFNTCQTIIGIDEVVSPIASMFPNPADASTRVEFASSTASYSLAVYDVLGKLVDSVKNARTSYLIQRNSLPAGVYFVQVTDSKGHTGTQKLIFN